MAVVGAIPADDDEVAWDVESVPFPATARAEPDVMQGGVLDELAAEPTTPVVALHDQSSHLGGNLTILALAAAAQQQLKLRRRQGR